MTTRLARLITGVFGGIFAVVLAIFAFSFYGMGYESGRADGCRATALSKPFTGRTLRSVAIDGEWNVTYWDTYCSVQARLRGQPDDRVARWRFVLESGDSYAQESWAFEVFPGDGRLPDPGVHKLPASDAVR
jgi:hypothetical protein